MNEISPTRRVILLGASNLTMSFPVIVETARRMWREPLEILAAMGHGRSYGRDSRVLGRKISGIFPCALWQDLQARKPLPTIALVTDVGNDLLYEVPIDQLLSWVTGCLDRLAEAGAQIVVTQLPMESIARLSEQRFLLFRRLLFPNCTLSYGAVLESAALINEKLVALDGSRNTSVIPVCGAWYGWDPIHLKRAVRPRVWPELLARCAAQAACPGAVRAPFWLRAYLACLEPHEHEIFGMRRGSQQPSGVLADGTTISLY